MGTSTTREHGVHRDTQVIFSASPVVMTVAISLGVSRRLLYPRVHYISTPSFRASKCAPPFVSECFWLKDPFIDTARELMGGLAVV